MVNVLSTCGGEPRHDTQTDMSLGLGPASYKLDELTKFLTAPRQFSHLKKNEDDSRIYFMCLLGRLNNTDGVRYLAQSLGYSK